jgi:transcriptional regulator with XRE-family HTH domain
MAQASKAPRRRKTARDRLPERIAFLRGDLSQRKFAAKLGIFQQNQQRYEAGTSPHYDYLELLATKLGVNLNWLVTGKGEPYVAAPEKPAKAAA